MPFGIEGQLVVRIDRGDGLDGSCTPPNGLAALRRSVAREEGQSFGEQRRLWLEAHARGEQDPMAPLLIPIGDVVLQANDDQQVELRLPEEWRQ